MLWFRGLLFTIVMYGAALVLSALTITGVLIAAHVSFREFVFAIGDLWKGLSAWMQSLTTTRPPVVERRPHQPEIVGAGPTRTCDILGVGMFDSAEIRVHPTGSAIARMGTITQGQGHQHEPAPDGPGGGPPAPRPPSRPGPAGRACRPGSGRGW